MAENSKIEWCDATFNPWWGCEKVSPACAHCYAEKDAARWFPKDSYWGAGHTFRFFGDAHWDEPLKWARTLTAKLGRRPRVFCASMADVFEEHDELHEPRRRLFDLIEATPELDWLILTKRPEHARDYFFALDTALGMGGKFVSRDDPEPFGWGCPFNVWLGVSIENVRFTWRADVLREIPAAVRFISAEPLLGSLFDSDRPEQWGKETRRPLRLDGIDWVIIGGESGPKARPFHLHHARELLTECLHAGVTPFVKQLGARPFGLTMGFKAVGESAFAGSWMEVPLKLKDRKGGDWDEWSFDLRVREFPRSPAEVLAA